MGEETQKKVEVVADECPDGQDFTPNVSGTIGNEYSNDYFPDMTDIMKVIKVGVADTLGDKELFDEANSYVQNPSPDLEKGVDLVNRMHSNLCLATANFTAVFVCFAILIGQGLNILRSRVKDLRMSWKDFFAKNIKGMSTKTGKKYMYLARRTDIPATLYCLGLDRLSKLSSATSNIGNFFKKYQISYNPQDDNLDDFKLDVDIAHTLEEASKKRIDLKKELVSGYNKNVRKITDADLDKFKAMVSANGDPNVYLEREIEKAKRLKEIAKKDKKQDRSLEKTPKLTDFEKHLKALKQIMKWSLENDLCDDFMETVKPEEVNEMLILMEQFTNHVNTL